MMQFRIHFHRYSRKTTRSKLSAPWFTKADTLRDALANAETFLSGMRAGGCDEDLVVASIETEGLRGEQCIDRGTIWDTEEVSD